MKLEGSNSKFPFTGQRADPVQNPKAYQDRDHVQDLKAVPEADPVLGPGLGHVPDHGHDLVQEIQDQTLRYPENPYPLVKTKLRLSCKYFRYSFAFNFLYLHGKNELYFQFCY